MISIKIATIIVRDGKVLYGRIAQEGNTKNWSFPIGDPVAKKSIESSALIIAKQNTDIDCKLGFVLKCVEQLETNLENRTLTFFVICFPKTKDSQAKAMDETKCDCWLWIDPTDIAPLTNSSVITQLLKNVPKTGEILKTIDETSYLCLGGGKKADPFQILLNWDRT